MAVGRSANPLVISAGEPAGIGPDLCIELADELHGSVIVADPDQLHVRARKLSRNLEIALYDAGKNAQPGTICVLPIDFANKTVCGTTDPANAGAILDGLSAAVDGCLRGEFSALVTGPVQKSAINDAGIAFTGHTEYIARQCGGDKPVMLLIANELRVALATTHLPLRNVPDVITAQRLLSVLRTLHADLRRRFNIEDPDIVVCGLNPHAGEDGHLGTEDKTIIAPAVAELQRSGMRVRGPVPADTAFTPAVGKPDAILAMYHDQGLPVLKYAGFGNAVNVTLGLPIVRTSVDHGTALDIAGSGSADSGSFRAAIQVARELTDDTDG